MAKYSRKAQEQVKKAMRKKKKGTLRSGSGKKVTSSRQALREQYFYQYILPLSQKLTVASVPDPE